jgi:hypothetical protein
VVGNGFKMKRISKIELNRIIRTSLLEAYQSHHDEPFPGDFVENINPSCQHFGSMGKVLTINDLPDEAGKTATYFVVNSGKTFDEGDILEKTLDQLAPLLEV